ncbi:MAG: ATP-binding cassette domain-containing protein [Clostridiales bacterium]|nr:ATP-binding cassette domain-containing protein [Clostridiales bacterium]MBR5358391.1 ATP-binding cassette domain-containing protein [Clostridiales bacterium]
MVDISNVSLNYKKTVLTDVNIHADSGECVGLLGLNGSGKSTLLSAIAGIKKPASGTVSCEGKIGFVTQENALIDELSALDNLRMWTPLSKEDIKKSLAESDVSALKVSEFIDVKVKRMSGGMKKRLALTSVLMEKPDILLLDEPLAGLDIPAKTDILNVIDSYRKGGGIVFVASHAEEVFAHCDKIFVLKNGKCSPLPDGVSVVKAIND